MKIFWNTTLLALCALSFCLAMPGLSTAEDNPRQAAVSGGSGGTQANLVDITSLNDVKSITAKDHSTVSVGDVEVSNVDADTVEITTDNNAGAIVAKDHSHVAEGSVNVSGFKGNTVKVFTSNTVQGGITAKDHSRATVGTVNVH